jgi:serine/threonine-protein kinase
VASSSCPDPAQLRNLVEGKVAPEEQAALAQHLDDCARCQATLERISAASDSWGEMQDLACPAAPMDSALANAMDQLQAKTAAEAQPVPDSQLSFLDPPDKPGQIGKLAHYEVLEVVGKGGMGIVLRVYDTKLQRLAAIKVMMPELAAQASARQRFIREARAAAAVSHDHIVAIHAIEEGHTPPYLVMQYIAGRSLQQRIDEGGALELKEILRIGLQTASGLAAAHAQGLVHRDIKPANILLENGVERVKITDFGLARAGDDARLTQTGVVTGTPQYMSPEQANGKAVDHRADLFSLGGVLYAMCTGYAPFRASSSMAVLKKVCDENPRPIHELNPEIPEWLTAIVAKLMAKEPGERFESASEVATLLGQHLAHLQQPAVFPQPPELAQPTQPASRQTRRSPALAALLVIVPILLIPLFVLVMAVLNRYFDWGTRSGILFLISVVVECVFLGVVLLAVQAFRRPAAASRHLLNSARPGPASNPPPRRSHSWVGVLVACILLLFVCPIFIVGGLLALYWATPRPLQVKSSQANSPMEGSSSKMEEELNRAKAGNNLRDIGMAMQRELDVDKEAPLTGLNWFPEETTFCASYNMSAAPPEMTDALWGFLKSTVGPPGAGNPNADIDSAIGGGTLSRVSMAYIEDPAGKRTRQIMRFSGLWNRDRVIQALSKRPGATSSNIQWTVNFDSPRHEEKVTLIVVDKEFAVAVVGSQDILLGGYEQIPESSKGHEEVIREALDCKASSKRSLRNGRLHADLATIPSNAFFVLSGEPPKELHEFLKTAFGVLPPSATITVGEGKGDGFSSSFEPDSNKDFIHVTFKTSMNSAASAETLNKGASDWAQRFQDFLDRTLKEAESQPVQAEKKKTALAEAAMNFRTGPKISVETKRGGLLVDGKIVVPPTVWRAALAWLKVTPMPGSATTSTASIQVLHRFHPATDKPIQTQVGDLHAGVEGDSWRIDATKPLPPGQRREDLRLFEFPNQTVRRGTVLLRFRMKTDKVNFPHVYLSVDGRKESFRDGVRGTTGWQDFEIRAEAMDSEAANIGVLADVGDTGTMWIKDMELILLSRKLLKQFDPKTDKPIQTDFDGKRVTVDQNTWRIDCNKPKDDRPVDLRLFELTKQDVQNSTIVLRFKVKAEKPMYVSLRPLIVGLDEPLKGTPNTLSAPLLNAMFNSFYASEEWRSCEVRREYKGTEPADIAIVLYMNGPGTVWLKDVELVKTPLPAGVPLTKVAPVMETPLKKFDPKVDKLAQAELDNRFATIEQDSWRIDARQNGTDSSKILKLFDVWDLSVQNSTVVLRYKIKSEKLSDSAVIALGLQTSQGGGRISVRGRPVRETTGWRAYEIRADCKDPPRQDIRIYADIYGTGTIWLKDVELVRVPLGSKGTEP